MGIGPGLCTMGGYLGFSKCGKYFAVHCIPVLNELYGRAATGAQVNGFSNLLQRGFKTVKEVQAAWKHACVTNSTGPPGASQPVPVASPLPPNHLTTTSSLAHNMLHSVVTETPSSIHTHKSASAGSTSPPLHEPCTSPSLKQAMPATPARSGVFQPLPSVYSSPRCVLHAVFHFLFL